MNKNTTLLIAAILLSLITQMFGQSYGRLDFNQLDISSDDVQTMQSFEESFALEEKIDPDEYILGPGDELGINILTSENITFPLKVTPTGDVFIPSVGVIHVNGLTLNRAIETIEDYIHREAYPGAKVSVALVNVRTFLIQVIGAVNRQGFVRINPLQRLSSVLSKSKGVHQFAREYEIKITRKNGNQFTINYLDFIRNGNLDQNPTFQEGDKVYVPFGEIDKEGVVLRGASTGNGYDIIEPNETLGSFLQRRVKLRSSADLNSISITRKDYGKKVFMVVLPKDLFTTTLLAGDTIDILWEKGVMVNGFVLNPGNFKFFPGYVAGDYINMAGGNTTDGNPNRCKVYHKDGTIETGQETIIRRGDVIVVPRTMKSILLGDMSTVQIIVSIATVYLTFMATQN